ncbi:autotransporter assembly complex family protein [Chitinibacter tainanensis]|uniref:autotransporter assembly complex protein TamA n=1 Tax=Chitinibacter tainanensis TaxID=230667 RepID=UPI0023541B0F|nr:autotransporter assembly complex family protein [Chitinibacter tainanensis]
MRWIVPWTAVLLCAPVCAQDSSLHYKIQLEAPGEVSDVLQYLNLFQWQKKNRLTPELLAREVSGLPAAATELLATAGYFAPTIESELRQEQNTPVVYLRVTPGPQTLVKHTSVDLQGVINHDPEKLARVNERLGRRGQNLENQPFSQSSWDEYKKRSLQILQNRDFPAASLLSSEASIDPVTAEASYQLVLDSGPAYVFGPYTIHGLSRYPEFLIHDRVKIPAGTPYSRSELLELQTELQNLPQFATALVDVELSGEEPYTAPIRIDVQEVPLHRVNGSVGYSTNTLLKSELAYRYLNLFNRGWVADSRIRLEQREQAFEQSVTLPQSRSDWEHRVWLSYLHQDLQGLDSQLYKTGVSRLKKGDEIERTFDLQYQIENRRFNDGSEERPQTLTLNHIWTQRKLDNRRNPRNGYLAQLEIGGASAYLLSDATFLRLYGRGAYYHRIGQDGQVILQGALGETFTKSPEGITSDWLFRAGGSGSVRGYDYQSLGVKSNGSVIGGQVLATASVEYQHPIVKNWKAALFVDHGGAGEAWHNLETVTGVGVGGRWNSPVGQIGFDLAYGVDLQQIRFHFAMGLVF